MTKSRSAAGRAQEEAKRRRERAEALANRVTWLKSKMRTAEYVFEQAHAEYEATMAGDAELLKEAEAELEEAEAARGGAGEKRART